MSARTFLITAGVLGGGYYLYTYSQDQRLQTPLHRGPAEHTGKQIDDTARSVRDKATGLQRDANRQIDGTLSTAETKRKKLSSWAGSKADEFDARAAELEEHAQSRLQRLQKGVKEDWESVKEKKEQWFKPGDPAREAELAERTRRGVQGWGETATANAADYYDSVVDGTKKLLGRSPDSVYEEAQRAYQQSKKRADDTASSWFSKADAEKDRAHAEAKRQLESAQKRLDDATVDFNEWKKHAKSSLAGEKHYDGFYDWLRGGYSYRETRDIDRTARDAVRGWGETAQAASEEVRDNRRGSLRGEARNQARDWSSWFNRQYEKSSEGAREYYNDANDSLSDAQRELERSTKHWWQVWKSSSKDLESKAKRDVEAAQNRVADATARLQQWGHDVNKSLWGGAERAVDSVKSGLNTTHDQSQEGLSQAKGWIKDQE